MAFEYSQRQAIKLCYKPCKKGENKDSYPLNFKRPWFEGVHAQVNGPGKLQEYGALKRGQKNG